MMSDNNALKDNGVLKKIGVGLVPNVIFVMLGWIFSPSLATLFKDSFDLDYSPFYIGLCLSIFFVAIVIVVYYKWISKDVLMLRRTHNVLILATKVFAIIIAFSICYVILQNTNNQNVFGLLLFSLCIMIPTILSRTSFIT